MKIMVLVYENLPVPNENNSELPTLVLGNAKFTDFFKACS